ncbi:hypothetical protein AB3S75_046233 [Citrus x aurantiifolia]
MAGLGELSLVDIIRAAITRYLQFSPHGRSDLFRLDHFCGNSPTGFPEGEIKGVELVHLLLLSAEKIGSQQFDRASIFLDQVDKYSSITGNAVQRLVHYFSKALRERFNLETGRITSKGLKSEEVMLLLHPEEVMASAKQALIACYQKVPFYQATVFAGIQAVIENVSSAKKIHIIDLATRTGSHCPAIMQALATRQGCPPELRKITMVVGTTSSKQKFEEIENRLANFAETINLPFPFNISFLTDIKDFETSEGEVVAVYSPVHLSHMIRKPNCLETFLTELRKINPCVMVVIEVESNDNLQTFEDRFFGTLFHFGALFDCLEVCMNRCHANRMTFEEMYSGQHIRNIIASEGEERIFGHMKIDGWRDLFNRFGLVEAELSSWSLFQAELILRSFACGSSCTIDRNGECLIIGWKGIPHLSLSVWKFHRE